MPDTFRLVRLVGDGDASGGGLPLPDAFTAVLQELLDHGPATALTLANEVAESLFYKEKRVLVTWPTWDDFTEDIIAQLADAGLITEENGRWKLTEKFTPGTRHVVIREAGIGVVVRRQAERTRLNVLARALVDARALETRLAQLDSESEQVETARVHLGKAVMTLEAELDLRPARTRGQYRKHDVTRPTSEEVARERYGFDGAVPLVKNSFGPEGTRPCVVCKLPRTPGEFSVYWEAGHNNAFFLRGACVTCEKERAAQRYVNRRKG